MMDPNELTDLERECVDHFLRWMRGLTTAREMWYLVALEQEHAASKEALQMMQHVGKQPPAAAPVLTQGEIDNELVNHVIGLISLYDLAEKLHMPESEVQTLIEQRVHTLSLPPRVAEKIAKEGEVQA